MKSRLLLVAMFSLLAQGASADCDRGRMTQDVDFLKNDQGALNCMNYHMKQELQDAWVAMGTCNEHANWGNLEACYKKPVCDYLHQQGWVPACPGQPMIGRHGRH